MSFNRTIGSDGAAGQTRGMDNEIRDAIAEVRAWAAREGGSMDHVSDAEVIERLQEAATSMPLSTIKLVHEHGLKRLAPVLARFHCSANSADRQR